MRFIANVEKIIKEQGEKGLLIVEHYSGLELVLERKGTKTVYGNVYGSSANEPTSVIGSFIGILQNDDFLPNNDHYSGSFETGFLITRCTDVMSGDIVSVKREDGKTARFKVEKKLSIGMTTEIFTKWEINNMGN